MLKLTITESKSEPNPCCAVTKIQPNQCAVSNGSFYPTAKETWCRKVRGRRRRGISFAWRQHRFFFVDFLLLALSYEKLEETGNEKEEEESMGVG